MERGCCWLSGESVFNVRRRRLNTITECGIARGKFLLYQPGNGPVRPVALHAGSELGDVFGLGIVHLEQAADLEPEGNGIERSLRTGFFELLDVRSDGIHRLTILLIQPRLHE